MGALGAGLYMLVATERDADGGIVEQASPEFAPRGGRIIQPTKLVDESGVPGRYFFSVVYEPDREPGRAVRVLFTRDADAGYILDPPAAQNDSGLFVSTLVLPDIPAGEQQVRAGVLALLKNESDVEAAATAQPIDVLNESLPKFVPE